MKIYGLIPTSLIEYPGEISVVLFVHGCNFRCPYCHNPESVKKIRKKDIQPEDGIKDFLLSRKELVDAVVITGGEPLLQEDIIDFLVWLKENDFKVKLDTNGSRPGKLEEIINKKLVDYIAMDYKFPLDRYHVVSETVSPLDIEESRNIIMSSDIDYEFRTTLVPALHHMDDDMEQIAKELAGAKKYVIQNFRGVRCLDKDLEGLRGYTKKELDGFRKIAKRYIKRVEMRD